ncbi:MAG: RNA-guided endonuclease InsQ/TnpB family protein [Steroidobacteraceae bacterium]
MANAQRRGHKRQAKRLNRAAARRRNDALHKFSRMIINRYQFVFVGDVSSTKLARTRMAKSVLDAGWSMLKTQLLYKGQQAGRCVEIVNEKYTTRTCSSCGALTGPTGLDMLDVRTWMCSACGDTHDRDVNAARNIRYAGRRSPSVSGNQTPLSAVVRSQTSSQCQARIGTLKSAA